MIFFNILLLLLFRNYFVYILIIIYCNPMVNRFYKTILEVKGDAVHHWLEYKLLCTQPLN
jgi:hypothetical protein